MCQTRVRACRECKTPLQPTAKATAAFCSTECKATWNNRRKNRGADLYDLFMAMRYDRAAAKDTGVWAEMCRMAELWNAADKEAGVKSFESPAAAINRLKDRGAIPRARPMQI